MVGECAALPYVLHYGFETAIELSVSSLVGYVEHTAYASLDEPDFEEVMHEDVEDVGFVVVWLVTAEVNSH